MHLKWSAIIERATAAAPEAFADGRLKNLVGGEWHTSGTASMVFSPVDGSALIDLSKPGIHDAQAAMHAASRA